MRVNLAQGALLSLVALAMTGCKAASAPGWSWNKKNAVEAVAKGPQPGGATLPSSTATPSSISPSSPPPAYAASTPAAANNPFAPSAAPVAASGYAQAATPGAAYPERTAANTYPNTGYSSQPAGYSTPTYGPGAQPGAANPAGGNGYAPPPATPAGASSGYAPTNATVSSNAAGPMSPYGAPPAAYGTAPPAGDPRSAQPPGATIVDPYDTAPPAGNPSSAGGSAPLSNPTYQGNPTYPGNPGYPGDTYRAHSQPAYLSPPIGGQPNLADDRAPDRYSVSAPPGQMNNAERYATTNQSAGDPAYDSRSREAAMGSTGYNPGNNGFSPPGVPSYQSPGQATVATTQAAQRDPHYRPGGTGDFLPPGGPMPPTDTIGAGNPTAPSNMAPTSGAPPYDPYATQPGMMR